MEKIDSQNLFIKAALFEAMQIAEKFMYLRGILEAHQPITDQAIRFIDRYVYDIKSLIEKVETELNQHAAH